MDTWNIGVELSEYPTHDEKRAKLLLELSEPLEVAVSVNDETGNVTVGMLLAAATQEQASERAVQLIHQAASGLGHKTGSIHVFYLAQGEES